LKKLATLDLFVEKRNTFIYFCNLKQNALTFSNISCALVGM